VVEAAGEYERCMTGLGYDVANPADAAHQARLRWVEKIPDEPPPDDEIAMADADAACQTESGVHATLDEAVLALAEDWITDNAETILSAAAAYRAALERSRDILGES
jgi:hypothetical protein